MSNIRGAAPEWGAALIPIAALAEITRAVTRDQSHTLFIAGFGAAGYATRRDLSALARYALWALVALIVFGIVLIFVNIPNGALIYAVLGLVIFAVLTMVDLERLRRTTDLDSAPLIAASIFTSPLSLKSLRLGSDWKLFEPG